MAHVGSPQHLDSGKYIPIWGSEINTPTLWVWSDDQEPDLCREYAEKVAGLINQDSAAPDLEAAPETEEDDPYLARYDWAGDMRK